MNARIGRLKVEIDGRGVRLASRIVRDHRRLKRALRTMPRPIPWEWARPRLIPLLAGPHIDPPGQGIVRGVSDVGPAIEFGIDLGGVLPLVDQPVAERWETSPEQLQQAALHNLRGRAAALERSVVTFGTLSGRITRFLRAPAGYASSLVLLPDELRRLLGDGDMFVGTPTRDLLLAMPGDTPTRIFADVLADFERDDPLPLLIDPFVLADGQLHWVGDAGDIEPDDDGA